MALACTAWRRGCFGRHCNGVEQLALSSRVVFGCRGLSHCTSARAADGPSPAPFASTYNKIGGTTSHPSGGGDRQTRLTPERLPCAGGEDLHDEQQTTPLRKKDLLCTRTFPKKPQIIARRRHSGGIVTATYEQHFRRLVLSISSLAEPCGGMREETAAAEATAASLIRASAVCEAAKHTALAQDHLQASAISALVSYAFAGGSEQSSGEETRRHVIFFNLPSLSPAALADLVYLCGVGLGVKDEAFLSEAARVGRWQLEVLQKHKRRLRSSSQLRNSSDTAAVRTSNCLYSGATLDDLATRVMEAPVRSPPRPGAHRLIRLLRGLLHAGHKDDRLLSEAVGYLESECIFTHNDLLHALALLKVMPSGEHRDRLLRLAAQRIILRERRLPLCVVAAASNVFSLLLPPPCTSSARGGVFLGELQRQAQSASSGPRGERCHSFSLEALFTSLASSAKRALEVSSVGIVDSLRGRDLALLARGFVRARQQAAALPWVEAMERHWRDLRFSFDPQSLALLLVSVPKLQRALPAKSECLTDLLRVFMQRIGSMTLHQLVMATAGLSRVSWQVGYSARALPLAWRFIFRDPQTIMLSSTEIQSLFCAMRRQEGKPVPSAVSALSKLLADLGDMRNITWGLRLEAFAFQSKFGAFDGHLVKALVESALSSEQCNIGTVACCLEAVIPLPWRAHTASSAPSKHGHGDASEPARSKADLKEAYNLKKRLLEAIQTRLAELAADPTKLDWKSGAAGAAVLSALCCLIPPLGHRGYRGLYSRTNNHPASEGKGSAHDLEGEQLPGNHTPLVQLELVPQLASILLSKSNAEKFPMTALCKGTAAAIKIAFRACTLRRRECMPDGPEISRYSAWSRDLEQLNTAAHRLLAAAKLKSMQSQDSLSDEPSIAGPHWLLLISSMCRQGVQVLDPKLFALSAAGGPSSQAAAESVRSNVGPLRGESGGWSCRLPPAFKTIFRVASLGMRMDTFLRASGCTGLDAFLVSQADAHGRKKRATSAADAITQLELHAVHLANGALPALEGALLAEGARLCASPDVGKEDGDGKCNPRRFGTFGLYKLAELLTAMLGLRLRIYILQNSDKFTQNCGEEVARPSAEVLSNAHKSVVAAAASLLGLLKLTKTPRDSSQDPSLYLLLAISAQLLKELEPLMWKQHASILHYHLKALASQASAQQRAHLEESTSYEDAVESSRVWTWAASKRKAAQAVMSALDVLKNARAASSIGTTINQEGCSYEKEVRLLNCGALTVFGSTRGLQVEVQRGSSKATALFFVVSLEDLLVPVLATTHCNEVEAGAENFAICLPDEVCILQPQVAMELFATVHSHQNARGGLRSNAREPVLLTQIMLAHEIREAVRRKNIAEFLLSAFESAAGTTSTMVVKSARKHLTAAATRWAAFAEGFEGV
ncbi:hypothetical protein Efla_006519 [Eimeria flavescens]